MKHYLVIMAALSTPAYAQNASAPTNANTQVVATTAAQLENAAQSIQLPPTAPSTPSAPSAPSTSLTPAVAQDNVAKAPLPIETKPENVPSIAHGELALAQNSVPTDAIPAVTLPKSTNENAPQAAAPQTALQAGTQTVPQATNQTAMPTTAPAAINMNAQAPAAANPVTLETTKSTETIKTTEATKATQTDTTASTAIPVVAEPNLTEHAFMAFGAVLGLGFFGITLVRLKKKGALGFGKNDRNQMEVISQLTLTPKRKVILVRIRDQEIALASTEHGITMLTEVSTNKVARSLASALEPKLVNASRSEGSAREMPEGMNAKKSESFLNALKNIKHKTQQQNEERLAANESAPSAAKSAPTATAKGTSSGATKAAASAPKSTTPTLGQTRAAFPKYLANAFQQEGNRKVSAGNGAGEEENLENVTNMIREKLKNINQAS